MHRLTALRQPKYAMLYPLLSLMLIFLVFPTVYAWYLSFNRVYLATYSNPEFCGFKNFWNTLTDRNFHRSLSFTATFTVVVVSVELVLGVVLAVFFNRPIWGKRLWISLLLLPMMVSPALIGIMYRLMLNEFVGTIAFYLKGIKPLAPRWVVPTVMMIDILQWTPFAFLIIYAALQTVPKELYEAAAIDGAGSFQKFQYITIPSILKMIVITALFRCIDAFKTFDMIYVLTAGGPGTMTTTVSIYIYKLAFRGGDIGRAASASILLLLIFSIPMVFVLKRVVPKEV